LKYFKKSEFECKCGCGEDNISERFANRLDFAREAAGVAFVINSGVRCEIHNKNVGGVPGSSHVASPTKLGHAADISAKTSREKHAIVASLLGAGFTRLGIAENFVHVDDDPNKPPHVIWTY